MATCEYNVIKFARHLIELINLLKSPYIIIHEELMYSHAFIDIYRTGPHFPLTMQMDVEYFTVVLKGREVINFEERVRRYLKNYEKGTEIHYVQPTSADIAASDAMAAKLINPELSDDVERVFRKQDCAKQIAEDEKLAIQIAEDERLAIQIDEDEKRRAKQEAGKEQIARDRQAAIDARDRVETPAQIVDEKRVSPKILTKGDDTEMSFEEQLRRALELSKQETSMPYNEQSIDDLILRVLVKENSRIESTRKTGNGWTMFACVSQVTAALSREIKQYYPQLETIIKSIRDKYQDLPSDKVYKLIDRLLRDHPAYCTDINNLRNVIPANLFKPTTILVAQRAATIKVIQHKSAAEISDYIQKAIA